MKVLILTTREFYQFFDSDLWQKIQCDNAKSTLEKIRCDDLSNNRLNLLKRVFSDSCFYAMPCIPEKYYADNPQKNNCFLELEKRQDYIGSIITDVMKDLTKTGNTSAEIWIVAHDRDLYDVTDERPLYEKEVKSTILKKNINNLINLENIYGFQHLDEPREWRVYPVITDYLSSSDLGEKLDLMEMFKRKIELRKSEFEC